MKQTRTTIDGACVRCGKLCQRPGVDHPLFTWSMVPPGWLFLHVPRHADSVRVADYRGVLACSIECAEGFTKAWCDE